MCSQWTRPAPRAWSSYDRVDRVERLDVEVGVVRELVVEHRLRPEHAGRVIDGDEPVEPHQQKCSQRSRYLRARSTLRSGVVACTSSATSAPADGFTLAVGQRRRAPADHVRVGHGRVARGGDDQRRPTSRCVSRTAHGLSKPAGHAVGAARGHVLRRRREREHLLDRRRERTAEADVAVLHHRLVEERPHASYIGAAGFRGVPEVRATAHTIVSMSATALYEKLGVFYLGKPFDLATNTLGSEPVLYDSKDLVTHAVIVGMTGSGKTGLGLSLIEEAAMDGVPVLAIDPKGDLGNLLLTFPNLAPGDFKPWVDADEANRRGVTVDAFAEQEAASWKKGLEAWGQDGARIARLRANADFAIYTPGSRAGRPVSILESFNAPSEAEREDTERMAEAVTTTATSVLTLLGVDADPVQSREHILLAAVLNDAWCKGENLDLAAIIHRIQQPPFTRVGVLDLEAFFPEKDRFALAMRVNGLLAAPSFALWLEGEPLDIATMLYTPEGKPRVAIVSVAHLSDQERMFFLTLLLNRVVSWMRAQSGTSSLRAMLYLDEVAGYMPPVANPPSKQALLLLMKQARAFGLGVVLATQNPIDIDYKGLSNAGTWFLGRLQTERDKARLLDGLEGALTGQGATFDRGETERILSSLQKRTFFLHDVHEDGPVIFQTRWAMSYLRGPLTKDQIKLLSPAAPAWQRPRRLRRALPDRPRRPARSGVADAAPARPAARPAAASEAAAPPVLPPQIEQFFAPARASAAPLEYEPALFAKASRALRRHEARRRRRARRGEAGAVRLGRRGRRLGVRGGHRHRARRSRDRARGAGDVRGAAGGGGEGVQLCGVDEGLRADAAAGAGADAVLRRGDGAVVGSRTRRRRRSAPASP